MIRKISDIFKEKEKTLGFEFFPPKTSKGLLKLYETALLLKDLQPDYCSVTYGAGGSTKDKTMEVVDELQKRFGLPVMHHLTCNCHTITEIKQMLNSMQKRNICNVLALYGDLPQDESICAENKREMQYCYELCKILKSYRDYFCVAVAGFPCGHISSPDRDTDIEYLKIKLESGGDFVITQLFFDNAVYFDYLERLKKVNIHVRVIPGILPIVNYEKMIKFCADCGVIVPKKVHEIFKPIVDDEEATKKAGIDFAVQQCRELLDGGACGLHFFTLNKVDPTREIIRQLREDK
ncbi:MAG: methylenetetrahydrofolate reductase [Candidatus Kappaea frigidicola]|nr:methylenetetrahydrofolate reductase [Candidatus Kappaea frigidicola]